MKKIVLALALVGGTLASNAQVYLGGKLGLWGTKDVKTEVTLAPEIGYKLSNNTAIGTSISYTLDDPIPFQHHGRKPRLLLQLLSRKDTV